MPSKKTTPPAKKTAPAPTKAKTTKPAAKSAAKKKKSAEGKGKAERASPSRRPPTTIVETPQITQQQFNVIAYLIRSREPACSAVELVLLKGWRKAEAGRQFDPEVSPQSVGNSVARFLDAHRLVSQYYGGAK